MMGVNDAFIDIYICFYDSLHIREEMLFVLGVGFLQLPSSLLVFFVRVCIHDFNHHELAM